NCAKIARDHGFGAFGSASRVTVNGVALTNLSWSNDTISATVPGNVSTGELVVWRSNPLGGAPLSSTVGASLHMVSSSATVIQVSPPPPSCDPYNDPHQCSRIQPAIDAA